MENVIQSDKFVKVFFGGHTETFGNVISDIGNVSIVVVIGLSSQFWKDWRMRKPANENPKITIRIQNIFRIFLVETM